MSRFVSIGEERYSSATIIDTEVNSDGSYSLEAEQPFGPVEFIEYKNENSGLENFYSGYTSGAKVLPNGNILLTEGDDSRLVELNPAGDKVWEYNVPSSGYMFRGEKYGTDFPGFDGKDMTPSSSTVETFPSTYPCNIFSSVEEPLRGEKTFLISQTSIGIEIVSMSEATFAYQLLDMQGKSLLTGVSYRDSHSINLESFLSGMYVLVIKTAEGQIVQTEKVVR